jgi:hypothetical protein
MHPALRQSQIACLNMQLIDFIGNEFLGTKIISIPKSMVYKKLDDRVKGKIHHALYFRFLIFSQKDAIVLKSTD